MPKQALEFKEKTMSRMYCGKGICKPLNAGYMDEHVTCIREFVANIFLQKADTTIMIDARHIYGSLKEKMVWLRIASASVQHILQTHWDMDPVGSVGAWPAEGWYSAQRWASRLIQCFIYRLPGFAGGFLGCFFVPRILY